MDISSYTASELEQILKAKMIQEQKSKSTSGYIQPGGIIKTRKTKIDSDIYRKIQSLKCNEKWFKFVCSPHKADKEYYRLHTVLPDTPKLTFLDINGEQRSFSVPTEEQYEELQTYYKDDSTKIENIEIAKKNLKWLKENQVKDKTTLFQDSHLYSWGDQANELSGDVSTITTTSEKSKNDKVDIHEFNLLKDKIEKLNDKVDELQDIIKNIQLKKIGDVKEDKKID